MLENKIKVGIIDLKINNIHSIFNAYKKIGCKTKIIENSKSLKSYNILVLPGVGAFKNAKSKLKSTGLENEIKNFVHSKNNNILFGICLGMQLMFEKSDEFGRSKGLNLIKGNVKKFNLSISDTVPHMTWSNIKKTKYGGKFFKFDNKNFYFVHSYYCNPEDKKNILFKTKNGKISFCSAVKYKNIIGVQFHPEKSGKAGIDFLKHLNRFL